MIAKCSSIVPATGSRLSRTSRCVVAIRFVATVALLGCTRAPEPPSPGTEQQVVNAQTGMVVSGSAIASRIGAAVLEQGGNAVDAAVATAFALSVVEPSMSGLGGRTQLLIRDHSGAFHGIDGGTNVPRAYPPGTVTASDDSYGYQTIGVPGTPAALAMALERHGTMPLARIIEPALELAREGFILSSAEAQRIATDSTRLRSFDGARRHFLKADGSVYRPGDRFIQTDLANVLEAIARNGVRAFYTGAIAERMANDIRAHGGWLSVEDLRDYTAESAALARGSYRGYELVGTYLPASGVTTIETLHILENFDLANATSVAWAGLLTQALLLAFEDREKNFGSEQTKAATLVSKDHARARAQSVRTTFVPLDHEWSYEPEHTTHLSVADARGGAVALTQSVGPNLGSRVATPGLGFLYAATMGYLGDVRPGDRPFSSQSPMIVLRDGQLRFVLGGAGARRIIPAIVAVLSRTIDKQLPLASAMALPRLHALPDRIDLEKRPATSWSTADSAALVGSGFTVRMRGDAPYFARIHAIAYDPATRTFTGVADPRWQGVAAAPNTRTR